ncbi:pre-mRNA-splicing factor CLF1 [Stereum hirsutum FP-91666 SS1]|uniref:pre-mRNA-splicing factor CLF1 n=1 Tax=Stereum hirsutum (strain FP-91666) TaxID=721885 RepID=UPI000440F0DA|nr:pre-mRNA-splicing factor CLF1 [Stereum hirsutum FP-91666 SS1]EIM87553.1 pre-mRNA-splicing factor CLF1 [Stereum hirsutum FP-91666 SS1]
MQDGRAPRIKNRAPAAIQITAEQLLREAQERQETQFRAPKQRVEDFEELHEYRGRKRKEFEERIRRTRGSIKEWLQYANWEASQNEFARARSVFERALDVDPRSIQLWLNYTDSELKARNVQHARNLFDRAVTLLPRIDQLWYKYVYLEELLQNVAGARQVFERWMAWEPDDKAWQAYIKMELRYEEFDRASAVYERWVAVRPEPRVWVKWGKFEEERGKVDKAREVFQTALEFFGDDEEQVDKAQAVFSAFAKMETRLKEYERARVIYKASYLCFALSRLPRSKSANLYSLYTRFEKQHGTRTTLETTVLGKRRIQYEEELSHDGRNYDVWFDYARLEEGAYRDLKEEGATEEEEEQSVGRVREVYERAVAQVPPGDQKRHWRRYIFLWLNYALFEEIETKDYARARQIYQTAVQLVPHRVFTFAKLWIMFAKFEVRRLALDTARKILGTAIGMCPKEALFKGYIQLEFDLREFDRARKLYEKYLEFDPTNSAAWIKYAELETQLADYSRARAIFELGVTQSPLSMPELLWKAYIDFEVEEGEREKARSLYERLVDVSGHWKVWVAFALFEAQAMQVPRDERDEEEEEEGDDEEEKEVKMVEGSLEKAREVFQRGYKSLKNKGLKNERVALLQVWKNFEEQRGTEEDVERVQGMMPVQGKRRYVDEETGQLVEDYDYIFADDERESNPTSFKFLQMAHAWKASGGGGLLSGFTASAANAKDDESEEESDEDDEKSSKAGDDEPMDQDQESVASSKGDD